MSEYKHYDEEINELASEVEEFLTRHTDHPQANMTAVGSRIRAIVQDILNRSEDAPVDEEYSNMRNLIEHRILSLIIYRSYLPAKEVT